MANVIVEIEMGIVDPDCMIEDRDRMKTLAIAGHSMQEALGGALDQLDVAVRYRKC
jgi:hypothetical protein